MDREQLEELRRWAGRLAEAGSTRDARAAAKAIDLLVEEVDRLEREVADARGELEAREREQQERAQSQAERARRRDERERRRDEGRREVVAAPVEPAAVATLEPVPAGPARRNGGGPEPTQPLALPDPFPAELLVEPAPRRRARPPRRRAGRLRLRRPPRPGRRTLGAVAVMAVAAVGAGVAQRQLAPDLAAAGPGMNSMIGAGAAEQLVFAVAADAATLTGVRWTIDGVDVTASASLAAGRSLLRGSHLAEGEHEVVAFAAGRLPGTVTRRVWRVSIDRTAPEVSIDPASAKGSPGRPLTLTGRVEPGATLLANGRDVPVGGDGAFELTLEQPPAKPVAFVATDGHGNTATTSVPVELVPRLPRDRVRSVHVTFYAWADDELRAGVMRLIDEGRINSVQLDLKDESGIVGFEADIPLAKQIGAMDAIYDLRQAVEELHAKGIYVIGRIVAFRDPIHAQAAWKRGWRNQVVQAAGGGPYAGYGGFTNFAHPAVRQYNIDVAKRAAELGVDDILFDYIRRPDGPTASMRFPQLQGTAEQSIASFLGEARAQLKPYDVFLGASVFGVAATRPHEIAQDIPAMARNADYIAPMLYPSHWGPGEYDVANPNAQPYDITFRSLKDFQEQVAGTGARVVPWLQDFTMGYTYGPAEVRAQIKAAADAGIPEWILWDPLVTYTADALDRKPLPKPIVRRSPPPRAATPAQPQPARQGAAAQAAAAAANAKANELGVVPVLMYHQIRADGGGDYDLTPAQFRAELARLHREGYVPIRAVDLVTGRIDVPAGKSPVVLTFDDSTKEQLAWDERKRPKPNTAIAIMLEFARQNPGFRPAGTFYVNREPFAGDPRGAEMLRWLHDNGFELGNHTHDHIPFNQLGSAAEVRKQLALGKKLITDAVPAANVRTLALPLGVPSEPPQLVRRGAWNGIEYQHAGVLLVGAEPAPSPFAKAFRPGAIPRIRTSPAGARDPLMGSTYWLDDLKQNPGKRYVSDGDPDSISFPRDRADGLAQRFQARAKPY